MAAAIGAGFPISDPNENMIVAIGRRTMLSNLDVLIREKTGLPVTLEKEPLTCVVHGCGELLESISLLKLSNCSFIIVAYYTIIDN